MDKITDILTGFGKGSQNLIQEALEKNNINATGKLSESVTYKVTEKDFVYELTISANDYFTTAVQVGRRPTRKKKWDKPGIVRKKIRQWVQDKPNLAIPSNMTVEEFVNATTNKIHKSGTELWINVGSKGKTSGILEGIFSDKRIDEVEKLLTDKAQEFILEGFIKFENEPTKN